MPTAQLSTRDTLVSNADAPRATMRTLQMGMGWFPEQSGGLNRYYYDLVDALPRVGVDCVGLVTGSDRAAGESHGRISAFSPTDVSILKRWSTARSAAAERVGSNDIDLVAAHFAYYALPVLQPVKRLPLVVHFHGPWAAESGAEGTSRASVWLKHRMEQRVYRRAQLHIVLSQAFADILSHSYGIAAERIRIVPGGVNTERFAIAQSRSQAREILGWSKDRRIVFAVRRLVSRMGLEDLIAAVERIRKMHDDVLVLIAGKGRLQEQLQAQIESAGLGNHVKLLGYLPDEQLPLAYRAADLSIVPTISLEGFGLIAAESLATGTPVLVTPVGGLPEVVRGLSTALILDRAGADAIADRLTAVLSGKTVLPSAVECQAYAQSHFAWSTIAGKVRAVYEEALSI